MSKQRNRKRGPSGLVWVMISAALVVAGFTAWQQSTPASREIPVSERRPEPNVPALPPTEPPRSAAEVKILTPKWSGDVLGYSSKAVNLPRGTNKYVFVVNGLLKQLDYLPAGAVADSARLSGNLLTLDFTPAFATTYGTEQEGALVDGVLRSVGQFPEVHEVQFTVGGRVIETLGNIELTGPQPVVRPEE